MVDPVNIEPEIIHYTPIEEGESIMASELQTFTLRINAQNPSNHLPDQLFVKLGDSSVHTFKL